ncbi:recombinase RecT [Niameybacter massiliensis]|uniref:Recombinase RecT n=1 Tax=Holtiella tumoricola TaxID=3018743 RepID=A0AA42DNP4_9FIRM|nr:RecT family recombinase [Holtiella tumoricola]MDA3732353.1 recombinase RecT [Holtiella tumoricola]
MSDNQVAVKPQKEITDSVLAKVNKLQENKSLVLPQNYVAGNALQSAALILAETVDNAKKPVLESCTKESIANSLLDMVKMGLEPNKKQCYFVAFGGKLQLMTSYFGKLAIAKRVSGLEEVKAFVIYEGDEFEMEFNIDDLTMQLKTYKPNPLNVNLSKITGAFAIPIFKDGTRGDLVYMSYDQIQKSWNQGYAKGKSGAHTNFTDEMCKKTIITRVCKTLINSSDDGNLIDTYQGADEESTPTPQAEQKEMTASKEFVDVPFVEDKQEVPAQVTAPTQEEIVCPI